MLKIYNTLTNKKEIFEPIDENNIKMYVCGPTVYARAHLGNARSVVVYDVLYRILTTIFPKVTYLRNITDVDDKIINAALAEGVLTTEIVQRYTNFFHEDMRYLNCLDPTFEPKATDYIGDMIGLIGRLIEQKKAYIKNGNVYFDVASFPNYGCLSKRNTSDQIDNVRISENSDKENNEDFVLWKVEKNATDAIFDSPWGKGRPGWHIECSAMTFANFGHDFDIHGGGSDLKFPHHENEIAQVCAAYEGANYAKYWIHNGFLTVDGQKMSKSLGNFITVEDIRKQNLDGAFVRYSMLRTHYSQPFDWSEDGIKSSKKDLEKICNILINYPELRNSEEKIDVDREFFTYLLDDMNTSSALMHLQTMSNQILASTDEDFKFNIAKQMNTSLRFLGFDAFNLIDKYLKIEIQDDEVEKLIDERKIARLAKDFKKSDEIRDKLSRYNIEVKDLKNNEQKWSRVVKFG